MLAHVARASAALSQLPHGHGEPVREAVAMLDFRPCPLDEEPAAALAQAMRDEMAALYDGLDLDGADMPKAGPGELAPTGATFVVGFEDGTPVCCGGLERLPDGACEIKRMFVVEAARGLAYAPPSARSTNGPSVAAKTGDR